MSKKCTHTVRCTCVGTQAESKVRPIKLTPLTKEEALQIVRLKSILNITRVNIKYDRTPSLREYNRKLFRNSNNENKIINPAVRSDQSTLLFESSFGIVTSIY